MLSIHEPFLVGAKFILDDIDTSFPNPADEMLFWDACHMIKLIRGYLHKEGTMTDPDGNVSSASEEHFMIFSPHQRSDTPKIRCKFSTTNFGSYLAVFCLVMDRQFLLFNKSCAWSFEF